MSEISDKVNKIATNYLGPATMMFMTRQTEKHMNGLKFESLEKKDLGELSKWVRISAGLIIDKDKATELSEKIKSL